MSTNTGRRLMPQLRRLAQNAEGAITDADLLAAFLATHDETAFASLVQRHGAMVLSVCRRIVDDVQLAEDAFQAVFMVLARRAATVHPKAQVGSWLHGVARRTALKARAGLYRRRRNEKQVDVMPQPSTTTPEEIWADLQPILDEELAHLTEKHRTLLVLCDLEGRPQRQVARELQLPPATVANRLAAARKALAKRLSDRGVVLSISSLGVALQVAHGQALPTGQATELARWAGQLAKGEPLAALAPPAVQQLTEGVMKMFLVAKLKKATLATLSGLLFAFGYASISTSPLSAEPATPTKVATKVDAPKPTTLDDAVFLRRLCLDLRGTIPTPLEFDYFTKDKDPQKRGKVTEWLLLDHPKSSAIRFLEAHHAVHGSGKDLVNCNSCHQNVRWGAVLQELPTARWVEMLDAHHDLKAEYPVQTDVKRWAVMRDATKHPPAKDPSSATDLERKVLEQLLQDVDTATQREKAALRFQELKAPPKVAVIREAKIEESDPLRVEFSVKLSLSDTDFLRKAYKEIADGTPTPLEERYFNGDADAKKREKIVEWLLMRSPKTKPQDHVLATWLKEPTRRQQWITEWKNRIEGNDAEAKLQQLRNARVRLTQEKLDPFSPLLESLLTSSRQDGQILEALMLATMGRFPTETEKKLITDGIPKVGDRKTAWQGILKTLLGTAEAKSHANNLSQRTHP